MFFDQSQEKKFFSIKSWKKIIAKHYDPRTTFTEVNDFVVTVCFNQ